MAAARQPVGDDGLHLAHQCRGMTTAACTAKADGWLLDRSRAMSTSSVTTAQDFDHALGGPVQGFAEIEGFSTTPVYADGEGRPATAVHYSLTLRTEQGVTSLSRTFCPGQTPRILPGKVDCS